MRVGIIEPEQQRQLPMSFAAFDELVDGLQLGIGNGTAVNGERHPWRGWLPAFTPPLEIVIERGEWRRRIRMIEAGFRQFDRSR